MNKLGSDSNLSCRTRSGIALGALAFVWLWAWSTPVLSLWLRGTVEDQYPPLPVATVPQAEALVVLGGGSDLKRYAYSEARAMAILLRDFGVPAQAMVLEEMSLNTRENAALSASLLKARGIHHILLVTSALHMPRALALFTAQGLQVDPAPTDFESHLLPPGVLAWLPDALALDDSGRAMKELVGKWVGW